MGKQGTFKLAQPETKSRSLHETILDALKKYGPRKQGHLAAQLGASESHLSEVMKGQKHWPSPWLDYIAEHYDFEAEIAAHFAEKRGLLVVTPRTMPPREWKRRVAYVLAQHNGMGRALVDEAMALPDDLFADEEEP